MRTRILVVEDDQMQMELICDLLTNELDVEVRTAFSVDQAMQMWLSPFLCTTLSERVLG